MTTLYTINCPRCNREQNGAVPKKELLPRTHFACSCGWQGIGDEGEIKEISKEEFLNNE